MNAAGKSPPHFCSILQSPLKSCISAAQCIKFIDNSKVTLYNKNVETKRLPTYKTTHRVKLALHKPVSRSAANRRLTSFYFGFFRMPETISNQ